MSYPEQVLAKHEQNRALLGAFRAPTPRTITASETLKTLLKETNYDGTMAVSVTEFRGHLTDRNLFVVAFSGYHPSFTMNRAAANVRLTQALQAAEPGAGDARFYFADQLDKVYHPMHVTTIDFFKKAFDPTFQATTLVTATMVDSALQRFKTIFADPASFTTEKPNLKAAVRKNAIIGVLGSALALRMDLVRQSDVPEVVRALRFMVTVAKATPDPRMAAKWREFIGFVQTLLDANQIALPTKAAEEDFTARAPTTGDKGIDAACKEAVQAWGANALGRFCAEPKAYACVRELEIGLLGGEQLGTVRGQLAFWYSNPPARMFSASLLVHGPQSEPKQPMTGAYMAPCTSCRNRSAEMLVGT